MKRTIWIALGLAAGLAVALTGARASAAQGNGGRYSMATHSYGQNNHTVVVVLDSVTGEVTPHVIHSGFSLSPGDLRLTQIRVADAR